MLIYIIIYIPLLLCAYYDFHDTPIKKKNQILWFWVIVFTLFRGLRWEVGTDWDQFHEVYYHSDWSNIFSYNRDDWSDKVMDYGYMFLNALFHTSGFSYTVFLLVTNFWIMWCYKDFSQRHTSYPVLTMIMLMNVGVPFPVRQSIALATSLWAYRFVVEQKWSKYLMVAFISALIHKASLISVPIVLLPYIIERWKIKWWYYVIAHVSTFVIAELLRDYIQLAMLVIGESNDQLQAYSDSYMNMDSTSVDYGGFNNSMLNGLSYTLFFAVLLFIKEKYNINCNNKIKSFDLFFFLYAMSAIIDNMFRQADATGMSEILGRITTTFDMFPVVFPLIFTVLVPRLCKIRQIPFFMFFVYMSYKFWQQIPGNFYHDVFIPYKSVLGL